MSQPFTLYHSDSLGRASNCMYPHAVEVTDAVSLAAAVSFDYVAVEYKNGYRNNANFIQTNCLMLDCDNDHSEDPAAWIPCWVWPLPSTTAGTMGNPKTAKRPGPSSMCFFQSRSRPIPQPTAT